MGFPERLWAGTADMIRSCVRETQVHKLSAPATGIVEALVSYRGSGSGDCHDGWPGIKQRQLVAQVFS